MMVLGCLMGFFFGIFSFALYFAAIQVIAPEHAIKAALIFYLAFVCNNVSKSFFVWVIEKEKRMKNVRS